MSDDISEREAYENRRAEWKMDDIWEREHAPPAANRGVLSRLISRRKDRRDNRIELWRDDVVAVAVAWYRQEQRIRGDDPMHARLPHEATLYRMVQMYLVRLKHERDK